MEDFEYSVEICDRDWECFFRECEECSLLPPSIAGLDDSGMSDIDDTRSTFAMRAQKVDLKAGLSEADRLINGSPDREGSPVEHYRSKHCGGGMESVLSGSEEDLHLQCVNMFFEGLKNGTEAEKLTEPSKVRGLKTREKKQEEKCNDGQHASSSILPKSSPKLNSPHANVETTIDKETTEPVRAISSNIMKINNGKSAPDVSLEPAVSNSVFMTNKSYDFFIREKAATVKKIDDGKQLNQSHASQDGDDCPETTTHSDKVVQPNFCMTQNDIKQEHLLPKPLIISSKNSTDLWSSVEVLTNVKLKDDQNPNVLQSDKTASQELSPSASVKRKRRKKRRLSVETAESVLGYERQTSVKPSDSEEEHCLWRGGTWLCASENFNFPYLNQPQKPITPMFSSSTTTNNLSLKMSPKDINVKGFSQHLHPCACRCQSLQEGIAEDNTNNDRAVVLLSQTNTGVISAQNTSGNVATGPNLCNNLGLEESAGLKANPGLSFSISDLLTGKSLHAGSVCQADKINHSIIYSETEHNPGLCTQEVKSITNCVLPSAESYDPKKDVCQNDKLSAAKSVLNVEAGKSGRNKNTLCQRETEPQQQLDFDCHYMDQYSNTMEKTQFPQSEISRTSSDTHDTLPKPTKTRACQTVEDISNQVNCDKFISESSNLLLDEFCPSKNSASQDKKAAGKQSESTSVLSALSQFRFVLEKGTNTEIELATPQIMPCKSGKFVSSVENNQFEKSQEETTSFMPEALPNSTSNITSVSSCCTVDTKSVMSLSNEIITYTSEDSSLPVSQHDSDTDKTSLPLVKNDAGDRKCTSKSQSVDTRWSKCESVVEDEDAVPAQDTKHPVFAMSSFWNEMEKLTINDILGLRRINQANPSSSLPPLQEIEETDMLAMTDSGFFNQVDEPKPEQSSEDAYKDLGHGGLTSGPALAISSSDSKTVLWEDEHVTMCPAADVYSRSMMLTSLSDIHEPTPPKSAQTSLRKISKNISVHNLPALESAPFSYTWKNQTLHKSNRGLLEKEEHFSDGNMPRQDKDCLVSSSSDSFKISLSSIFQYLFSGKQPIPSQSDTDVITSRYTDGNSVSENYDNFFSDFDTESFFCPLLTTEDQVKDEMVPIFSCSRSSNRNLQYPESYEHFFASSSSDDSSDDEDNSGPVRVVTRFSRTSSASRICTDIYDNFYTDKDLRQNFFWKNTLSFRNLCLSESTVRKQTPSNHLASAPLTQGGRPIQRTVHTMNALGNQDVMIPDPLLFHMEDRIYRKMFQPVIFEDLQMAVSNPSLDASLLPLKQSDMCLLCIAFASWVLKTTNPQVGDAWKAVLLANVSALSAIRYLRKYIRREATSSERRLLCNTAPNS